MQIAAGGPSGSGIGPEKSGPLFGPLGVEAKGYNLSFRPHFGNFPDFFTCDFLQIRLYYDDMIAYNSGGVEN